MKHERSKGLFFLIGILIFLFAVITVYVLLAVYYRHGFGFNTWINGVYCTGKSVEEVNAELVAIMDAPVITVTDRDGEDYRIILADADYSGDYLQPLQDFQEEQNSFFWLQNAIRQEENTLLPVTTYDETKLHRLWNALPFVKEEKQKKDGLRILYDEKEGFTIDDGVHGRFDMEKAYEELADAVQKGETKLSYGEDEYYDVPMTLEEQDTWRLWNKIDAYQNARLVYDIGDKKVCLGASDLADFLKKEEGMPVLSEDDELMIDEKQVKSFIAELAEQYDTVGIERKFQSTRGDVITISGGTYGMKLDQKEEIMFLTEYLSDAIEGRAEDIDHEVIYSQTTKATGEDDIGNTYVEVDMSQQMLYYYEDGILLLQTEVVTGNLAHKTGTPPGVDFVYAKQKNRTLRGDGYESFVKYWMPVYRGVGLHDASWRSKFGGEIYKTAGSHGCVNLPTSIAGEIYDLVEIGTPVVMFY